MRPLALIALMGFDALAALPLLGASAAGVDARLVGLPPLASLIVLASVACLLGVLAWFSRRIPLALLLRVKHSPHVIRITRQQAEDQAAQEALYAEIRRTPPWRETHGP